jgi:acyl-CoA thioesterase I
VTTTPNLSVLQLLESGQPVKIACFGDSITGIYYHTGGRQAWSHALGDVLKIIHPRAQLEMINAGISGNTTTHALARLKSDVLDHQPDLIVVMLGMNDVVHNTLETFRRNLRQIVQLTLAHHAEVVLMTPNAIAPDDPARIPVRLAEYAQAVREVAQENNLNLSDAYQVFEDIRVNDHHEWMRIMSDPVHPNMRGHQLFAITVAETITGHKIDRVRLPNLPDSLPHLASLLNSNSMVRITAMKPYDELIVTAIRTLYPHAKLDLTALDPIGKSIAEIEQMAKTHGWSYLRENQHLPLPDLTVIAVPADAAGKLDKNYYRSYTWVLNWSQSFGNDPRSDCLPILPSVLKANLTAAEAAAEDFARLVIKDTYLPFIQRRSSDDTSTEELLSRELAAMIKA